MKLTCEKCTLDSAEGFDGYMEISLDNGTRVTIELHHGNIEITSSLKKEMLIKPRAANSIKILFEDDV